MSQILDTIGSSPHLPTVSLEGTVRLARASPYRIELEKSDQSISPIFSTQCGWLREQYLDARQKVSDALMDLEEVIYNYDRVAETKDPDSFIKEFERLLADEHPFYRASYGAASDALTAIGYLTDGLSDIRCFERALEANGLLEWSRRAFEGIRASREKVEPVLESADGGELIIYWTEQDDDPVLCPEFAEPTLRKVRLVTRTRVMEEHYSRLGGESKLRRVTTSDVTAAAGSALRGQLEKEIGFDWMDWAG